MSGADTHAFLARRRGEAADAYAGACRAHRGTQGAAGRALREVTIAVLRLEVQQRVAAERASHKAAEKDARRAAMPDLFGSPA